MLAEVTLKILWEIQTFEGNLEGFQQYIMLGYGITILLKYSK